MARADTIIKSVSERPNGMFPPGNHVRACGTSVTLSSEQENLIMRKSENFSDYLKNFQIFSEINPKSVGDFSVTSEVDSESLNTLRKNIFKRSPCKSLGP